MSYKETIYDGVSAHLGAERDRLAARVKELEEKLSVQGVNDMAGERNRLAERVKALEEKRDELRRTRDGWADLFHRLKDPLAKILGTEHIETIVEKVKALAEESPKADARNWARLYGELIADYGLEPDLSKGQYEEVATFIAKQIKELNDTVDELRAENDDLREQLAAPDERPTATVYNFVTQINLN